MSLATSHTVSSLHELLDQVRACVGDVSPGVTVSLTIDVAGRCERTVFRLAVAAEDSFGHSPAGHLSTSPRTTSPAPHGNHTNMAEASEIRRGHANAEQLQKRSRLLEAESRTKEADQQGGADDGEEENSVPSASAADSSMEGVEETTAPSTTDLGACVTTPSSTLSVPSRADEHIRRSARKQLPVDRLVFEARQPRGTGSITTSKRQRTEALASTTALAVETTDSMSASSEASDAADNPSSSSPSFSSFSSSSSFSATASPAPPPSSAANTKRGRYQAAARANTDSEDEEEQVVALMKKFEDAYTSRDDVSLEQTSRDAVLTLGRTVLDGLSGACTASAACINSATYQQHAVKLDHLIATSSAARMLGYYLKGALAAKLKLSRRTKYVQAARTLLRLKSSADICAYPAFYEFVQRHCPSMASGVVDVEAWLKEPIFLTDIAWSEWRRYLSKRHCWMVSAALERFHATLAPAQDWMQRGWVEEYDDVRLGRGVRALRDIPLPSTRGRQRSLGDAVVADLAIFAQAQALIALDVQQAHQQTQGLQHSDDRSAAAADAALPAPTSRPSSSAYKFEWGHGKHVLNAERLWLGNINHLPEKHCNLRLSSNGKLVQVRSITAGEALTFDYSVSYWVERVTGVPWKQWMATGTVAHRKGCAELFERMHRSVLDYTELLAQRWSLRFAQATSELETERVIDALWQQLVPRDEQQMEEDEV